MALVNTVYDIPPLSNFQIANIMNHLRVKPYFKGVYDMDSLPKQRFAYPWAIIVNTEKDTTRSIGHWICMLFDKYGRGHYFDSYGSPPPHKHWRDYLVQKSLNRIWKHSSLVVQRLNTSTCGYLCIDYIVLRLKRPLVRDNYIASRLDPIRSYRKYRVSNVI